MRKLSDAQSIELFHIAFLELLARRLDPGRYVLKGGANLRYFFESVRYSEDIDLDLTTAPPWNLSQKVDGVLEGAAIATLLRASGLSVAGFTKPTQTQTTMRWKIALRRSGRNGEINTKVEFSNRGADPRHRLEAIPGRVVSPYALRAPSVQHYVEGAPLALPYAAYRDQVLPFLDPEVRELYEGEESWEQMQTLVAERLEEAT